MNEIFKSISVKLLLENLFPGILITSELLILYGIDLENLQNEFFKTTVLFVFGYSIGVVSSIISRLIVDFCSENVTRWIFLQIFAHIDLDYAFSKYSNIDEKFYADFAKENKRCRLVFRIKIAKWNSIYRSALRLSSDNQEVQKRREQGRYIRNLLFPLFGGSMILCKGSNLLLIFTLFILCLIITTLLYSYAELMNFAEGNDIAFNKPTKEKTNIISK